ncbi:F0F1 ATP synthase subunit epsilon [Candidatus Poribacteria bacterium]|nr:F0F1 ATP synthase subunit epsilon [Candidatus Poribacteria bacterium]
MLEKRFHLEIRTPQKLIYDGNVASVRAPGVLGSFEILAGHIPFLTVLEVGEIRIRESEGPQSISTSGGVFEVLRTGVTVLADAAEWAYEIDVERAEAARQRALQRLASREANIDFARAQAALVRATNRLKIAGR